MAPDFEIFQKLEIMRMISVFLPNLRLSAVGTPELRLAAHAHGYPCLHCEFEDCDPMRTASAHRFSRIVDYETMRMVRHTYVGQVLMSADSLAWLRDRR